MKPGSLPNSQNPQGEGNGGSGVKGGGGASRLPSNTGTKPPSRQSSAVPPARHPPAAVLPTFYCPKNFIAKDNCFGTEKLRVQFLLGSCQNTPPNAIMASISNGKKARHSSARSSNNADKRCRNGDGCRFQHIGLVLKVGRMLINIVWPRSQSNASSRANSETRDEKRKRKASVGCTNRGSVPAVTSAIAFTLNLIDKAAGALREWVARPTMPARHHSRLSY